MIELSNVTVGLDGLGNGSHEREAVRRALLKRLHLAPDAVTGVELRRRSIDARRGHPVRMVYTVRASLRGGADAERALLAALKRRGKGPKVEVVSPEPDPIPLLRRRGDGDRPVVVGAGCAGLFCAWALARQGLAPLLLERGDDASRRTDKVALFDRTGMLDPESNIQFGLGGAGTFSDGKLSTGTKSPYHRRVLEAMVEAGADPNILVDAKPHVGSDVLPRVVANIAAQIEELGGEVRFRTRLTGIVTAGSGAERRVAAVEVVGRDGNGVERQERIGADRVVLACGHSARDVFELLRDEGVSLERKTFSMGVRIEHLQADVDRCQYGPAAGNPILGPAPYKLVARADGLGSAYSFCMCPGGTVVAAASEPLGVVTNGMSLAARDGVNANAGLLVNVTDADLSGTDVLAGVELQRRCEQAAYRAGGGAYKAPAQLVGDFLAGTASTGPGHVLPTYPRGVTWGSLDGLLPDRILATLRATLPVMARKLRCFGDPEAVLTGVETRSSSPVRVVRGEDYQSVSVAGLYPVGEGAGYAGGIMSAAADGIACAMAIVNEA